MRSITSICTVQSSIAAQGGMGGGVITDSTGAQIGGYWNIPDGAGGVKRYVCVGDTIPWNEGIKIAHCDEEPAPPVFSPLSLAAFEAWVSAKTGIAPSKPVTYRMQGDGSYA